MNRTRFEPSRRQFVKKTAYIPPAILTLAVAPSFVKAGSNKEEKELEKEEEKALKELEKESKT